MWIINYWDNFSFSALNLELIETLATIIYNECQKITTCNNTFIGLHG